MSEWVSWDNGIRIFSETFLQKTTLSSFAVNPNPASTGIMLHMMYFGGNELNENFNLFIFNYNRLSVPESLMNQMVILYM